MSVPKEKLTYFAGRGRAEHIRLLFAAGKRPFEDNPISGEEWPALKPNTPYGSLPVLEVNGKQYGQSLAIARYVADEVGLYGSSSLEKAEIDGYVDYINDLREALYGAFFVKDDDQKKAKIEEVKGTKLPAALKLMEGKLGSKSYLVGNKLSWADIHFYHVMECFDLTGKEQFPNVFEGFAKLKALYDRVRNTRAIADYLQKRPQYPF